jgi:hypothetical protein
MTILGLILLCVIVGVVLWLVNTYVPMQPAIKSVMNAAVVIVLVLYLISAFGLLGPLNAPIRPVR